MQSLASAKRLSIDIGRELDILGSYIYQDLFLLILKSNMIVLHLNLQLLNRYFPVIVFIEFLKEVNNFFGCY